MARSGLSTDIYVLVLHVGEALQYIQAVLDKDSQQLPPEITEHEVCLQNRTAHLNSQE